MEEREESIFGAGPLGRLSQLSPLGSHRPVFGVGINRMYNPNACFGLIFLCLVLPSYCHCKSLVLWVCPTRHVSFSLLIFLRSSYSLLKMREVISVHVGQAGVQIGNACCMSFFPFFFAPILSWLSSWHGKRTENASFPPF